VKAEQFVSAEFMTVAEAADLVRKIPKTVCSWIKAGKLAAIRLDGSYLIRSKDLELFLRGRWGG
jgi:excisionase family DNA binding protein